jgi:type I restriction-modification system DNA methylase subunit
LTKEAHHSVTCRSVWRAIIRFSSVGTIHAESLEPGVEIRALGSAYEWLIKYFADSAGKKAGEFYTPAEVVRVCVEICDPQPNMSVYDPTVSSGGMLIQARDYIRECGGDDSDLSLYGQEKNGHHLVYLQNEYAAK